MKEKFLQGSMNFITKNETLDEETKEKVAYGLEGLYISITKLLFLNLVALVLGFWFEFILSLVLFNLFSDM